MKLHPRELLVRQVELDVFGDYVGSVAKYAIREERHPGQPDKPGGLD